MKKRGDEGGKTEVNFFHHCWKEEKNVNIQIILLLA